MGGGKETPGGEVSICGPPLDARTPSCFPRGGLRSGLGEGGAPSAHLIGDISSSEGDRSLVSVYSVSTCFCPVTPFVMSDLVPATTRALQVTEVALEILSHLDCSSLSRMSLVNRKFKALAECELYTHPGLYDPNEKFEGYREEYQAHRQRLMRVIGTIQIRTELALKVRKVDLIVVQNVDQVNLDLSYAQPIASLLQLTKKLRYVKLRGKPMVKLGFSLAVLVTDGSIGPAQATAMRP